MIIIEIVKEKRPSFDRPLLDMIGRDLESPFGCYCRDSIEAIILTAFIENEVIADLDFAS